MFGRRWLCWAAGVLFLSCAAAGCGAANGRLTAGPAHATVALDLRKVDWANVTLPGAACDSSQPIHLHRPHGSDAPRDVGTAMIRHIPRQWAGDHFATPGVTVDTGPVVYGDLDGSGHDNAALMVDCTNGSGTADGEIAFTWVVFSRHDDRLSVVGIISAQAHHPPTDPPTVINIAIAPRRITAWEFWDVHLPGSGRWATTIWAYSHGTLRPGVPKISRQGPQWFRACIARGDGASGCSLDANPSVLYASTRQNYAASTATSPHVTTEDFKPARTGRSTDPTIASCVTASRSSTRSRFLIRPTVGARPRFISRSTTTARASVRSDTVSALPGSGTARGRYDSRSYSPA